MAQGPHDDGRHLRTGHGSERLESPVGTHAVVGAGDDAQLVEGADGVVHMSWDVPARVPKVVIHRRAPTVAVVVVQLDVAGSVLVALHHVGQIVDQHRVERQIKEGEQVQSHVGAGDKAVRFEGGCRATFHDALGCQPVDRSALLSTDHVDVDKARIRSLSEVDVSHGCGPGEDQRHLRASDVVVGGKGVSGLADGDPVIGETVDVRRMDAGARHVDEALICPRFP